MLLVAILPAPNFGGRWPSRISRWRAGRECSRPDYAASRPATRRPRQMLRHRARRSYVWRSCRGVSLCLKTPVVDGRRIIPALRQTRKAGKPACRGTACLLPAFPINSIDDRFTYIGRGVQDHEYCCCRLYDNQCAALAEPLLRAPCYRSRCCVIRARLFVPGTSATDSAGPSPAEGRGGKDGHKQHSSLFRKICRLLPRLPARQCRLKSLARPTGGEANNGDPPTKR